MIQGFKIEGIITALLTPLTSDEQVKEDVLRKLIELAKQAKDLGVDATGAVGPFFYKLDTKGLIQHYKRIGEVADIPLLKTLIYQSSLMQNRQQSELIDY